MTWRPCSSDGSTKSPATRANHRRRRTEARPSRCCIATGQAAAGLCPAAFLLKELWVPAPIKRLIFSEEVFTSRRYDFWQCLSNRSRRHIDNDVGRRNPTTGKQSEIDFEPGMQSDGEHAAEAQAHGQRPCRAAPPAKPGIDWFACERVRLIVSTCVETIHERLTKALKRRRYRGQKKESSQEEGGEEEGSQEESH